MLLQTHTLQPECKARPRAHPMPHQAALALHVLETELAQVDAGVGADLLRVRCEVPRLDAVPAELNQLDVLNTRDGIITRLVCHRASLAQAGRRRRQLRGCCRVFPASLRRRGSSTILNCHAGAWLHPFARRQCRMKLLHQTEVQKGFSWKCAKLT